MKNPWKLYVAHIEKHLTPYNVYFTPKEFIAMKGFGLLVGLTVGTAFAGMHYATYHMLAAATVVGVGFSILGHLMPNMYIKYLSKQNKNKLQKELDLTLETIKEKMSAEQDLMTVLQAVSEQTASPIAEDLKRIHDDYASKEKTINFEELEKELKKNA